MANRRLTETNIGHIFELKQLALFYNYLKNIKFFLALFTSPNCPGCFKLKADLNHLLNYYHFPCIVIDIFSFPELAREYQIRSVPTLLFLKEGVIIKSLYGAISSDKLESEIKEITGL